MFWYRSVQEITMAERITTTAELRWLSELAFDATSAGHPLVIDSNGQRGPSPMHTVAISLAGCMAIDVVDILTKGRHEIRSLRVEFKGVRAPEPPKKFQEISLNFAIDTSAPANAIDRAIALSRDKYCSVWHSMREGIRLEVTHGQSNGRAVEESNSGV
jgi:putative redox protein